MKRARKGSTGSTPVDSPMFERLYRKVFHSKHSDLYLAIVIIALATIPRLFYISRDIDPNGVDEGIQIMTGRMMDAGYEFYSDLKPMQTPLMFSLYGLIKGDVVIFRVFSTLSSLMIMACVMWVAYRIGGRYTMVASGGFMALDIMFLHESRLASLDMFSLLWVVLGIAFIVKFRQSGRKWALIFGGACFAVSSMIKLFGVIAAGAVGMLLVLDMASGWKGLEKTRIGSYLPPKRIKHVDIYNIILFSLSYLFIMLLVMARYGAEDVIRGAFLDQLNRPVLPFTRRLSFFGGFLLMNILHIPFFIFGIKPLYRRPEGVVLVVTLLYFMFFIFQATTWMHHLIFLSPTISLTAGMGIIRLTRWANTKYHLRLPHPSRVMLLLQVFMILMVAIIGGAFSLMVMERGESAQRKAASMLMDITEEDEFVISGDPLIPAIAKRPVPPNVVNVASLQYPELTDDELNQTVILYGVQVVILSYHLDEMQGFKEFIEGNFTLRERYMDKSLPLIGESAEYKIYVLPESSPLRNHPLWGSKGLPSDDG